MAENIYIKYNIDKSKLKRDYILNPLRKSKQGFITKIEEPYKEDIHFLYNICMLVLLIYLNILMYQQHHFINGYLKRKISH